MNIILKKMCGIILVLPLVLLVSTVLYTVYLNATLTVVDEILGLLYVAIGAVVVTIIIIAAIIGIDMFQEA